MGKKLNYRECLETIDTFAVRVAQRIVGGALLHHSHRQGDLFHAEWGGYTEVKASGLSNGPIIEESQLLRNCEDSENCVQNYIFVCYINRGQWRGKLRNLPIRIGKSSGQAGLERFLTHNLRMVYIIPVAVIQAIYEKEKEAGKVVTHGMKQGPKTYFRLRYPYLNSLTRDTSSFGHFGLNSTHYDIENEMRRFRLGRYSASVTILKIVNKVAIEEDDSFDIAKFEAPDSA